MEAHLVQTQTRGRVPAGPLASPTATSTSTSTSAISPLPPPSRPLPSPPLPSLLPAQPHSHSQPRPSDETFTAAASTRTDVRSSVQAQTQFTSDRVSGPGPSSGSVPVSEIACTSEEGGGKKTKKEKKEKVPKVKKAKEVQEKVKVKQPRFVSVPCPLSRLPCPVSCVSFCFMSRPVIPLSLLCPFRPFFNFRVFAAILPHILLSFLFSLCSFLRSRIYASKDVGVG